jgi:excisionase family DNA binding protein
MTILEVAEFLQLSERTIKRLVKDRQLPFLKIGHSVRFSRRRLIEILDNGANTNLKPRGGRTRKD